MKISIGSTARLADTETTLILKTSVSSKLHQIPLELLVAQLTKELTEKVRTEAKRLSGV